jgi:Zn-dependent M28 family amino/carboxypeptidase
MQHRKAFAALGLALALTATSAAGAPAEPGKAWWAHIEYLADDALQGRMPGTPGYEQAAAYVAGKFKAYGLKPLTGTSYLQPIQFTQQRVVQDRSSVALVGADGAVQPLVLGEDLRLTAAAPQPATIEAPLVFIGYGLHLPKAGYDDFAGQDLKGKILVMIDRGGPAQMSDAMKAGSRSVNTNRMVEQVGALGVVTLQAPRTMDVPWVRQRLLAGNPGMFPTETGAARGARFAAFANPASQEKLFARSGHTWAEVMALADASKPIKGFALNVSLRAAVTTESSTLVSPNIVGVLPGSDPKLAKEYVLVSAHLDHLGVGAPINGDAIYNGAMDDASGVATVLEIARSMGAAKSRPKRSVLFLAFTGEERGLLGSRVFADRPGVPRNALVADLNMDMALPLWPFTSLYMPGEGESTLGAEARTVATARGIAVVPDPFPDRNVFTRTDQFSFVRAGVPGVALKFGFLPGTPQAEIERAWRANRYHSPSDDLKQPVDLAAADTFNGFVQALAIHLANAPGRPTWNQDSIFAPAN